MRVPPYSWGTLRHDINWRYKDALHCNVFKIQEQMKSDVFILHYVILRVRKPDNSRVVSGAHQLKVEKPIVRWERGWPSLVPTDYHPGSTISLLLFWVTDITLFLQLGLGPPHVYWSWAQCSSTLQYCNTNFQYINSCFKPVWSLYYSSFFKISSLFKTFFLRGIRKIVNSWGKEILVKDARFQEEINALIC